MSFLRRAVRIGLVTVDRNADSELLWSAIQEGYEVRQFSVEFPKRLQSAPLSPLRKDNTLRICNWKLPI